MICLSISTAGASFQNLLQSIDLVISHLYSEIHSSYCAIDCPSMDVAANPTQAVIDPSLPSIAEVRKAIEDHILTLEPRLRALNQHVSENVSSRSYRLPY